MQTICSHTLVKNGMPFIEACLRQVIPYVDRSLITISVKSNDGTLGVLSKLKKEFPDKVFIEFENVRNPGELTLERQKQINQTTEDWILFLDDDDFWPSESIEAMLTKLDEDVDGFSVNPYQVYDSLTYDVGWYNKFFLKWFRNQKGVHYERPWPRDMIFKDKEMLYWKTNPRCSRVDPRFIHLSYLKYSSFRTEGWATDFHHQMGRKEKLPLEMVIKMNWLRRRY